MAVSVAVCEIFSAKEWCDLENRVRIRSRSLIYYIWSGSRQLAGSQYTAVKLPIPTVNYLLTKEIGTYSAANGLALVEFKFMTTSVLAGAKNKQVIKININQTKNNFITPKQISVCAGALCRLYIPAW